MDNRNGVIKNDTGKLEVEWNRCTVDKHELKNLVQKRDFPAWAQTLGYIALCGLFALLAYYFFMQSQWLLFGVSLFLFGTVHSFNFGIVTHEFSHRTVFRARFLNEFFLRFFSTISWFNFHNYRMSHKYHHLYTLHPEGDREVTLPNKPDLSFWYVIQLLTINITGNGKTFDAIGIIPVVWGTIKLAFTGRFHKQWLEDVFFDKPKERKKAFLWAWWLIIFNGSIIAVSAIFNLWILTILIAGAPFYANFWRYLIVAPQHTGLIDNSPDFRECTRTIKLDPISGFLYWHMQRHVEHHMYAAVPFYNLKRLNHLIKDDMPVVKGLFSVWREMRITWKLQKSDPSYHPEIEFPNE